MPEGRRDVRCFDKPRLEHLGCPPVQILPLCLRYSLVSDLANLIMHESQPSSERLLDDLSYLERVERVSRGCIPARSTRQEEIAVELLPKHCSPRRKRPFLCAEAPKSPFDELG
jgi:hypothetical protein